MITASVPWCSALAVLAIVGLILTGLQLQALQAVTQQRVERAGDAGGPYLQRIVERRGAATAAVSAVRSFVVVILAYAVFSIGAVYVDSVLLCWVIGILTVGILLLVLAIIFPPDFGARRAIPLINMGGIGLWWLTRIASVLVTKRESDTPDERELKNEDELHVMVERVAESDVLEDDERSMLNSVFELSDTIVREVMVPRTDMLTIDAGSSLDDALSLFTRSAFSRIPVVGEEVDDLLGVVYLKDVIGRVHHRTDTQGLTVDDVMREPIFIPEFVHADDLLEKMQAESIHIAFAVDEWGGIAGLITIEDILEELVGEVVDEHDKATPEAIEVEPGVFRVPARMPLDEIAELFDIDIDEDDVDSIGGLLTKGLGRLPIAASTTTIDGLVLQADRFEGRRKRLATVLARRAEDDDGE